MRRLLFTIAISIFSLATFAAGSIIERADKAYNDNQFQQALELYQQAMQEKGTSSVLYYNIGNAYYRMGELGQAVLYYKKALKLDPSNTDARLNLEFVKTKLVDDMDPQMSFARNVNDSVVFMFSADTWAVLSFVLFVCFLISLAVYLRSDGVTLRKSSFFGGIVFLVLTVFATIMAFQSARRLTTETEGVVVSKEANLFTVPRSSVSKAEEAFTLHEGTIVEILDSLATPADTVSGMWYEVQADADHRAWIPAADLRKV